MEKDYSKDNNEQFRNVQGKIYRETSESTSESEIGSCQDQEREEDYLEQDSVRSLWQAA